MGGNGYRQNLSVHQKTTFLPMLCSRPSMKDVAIPNKWELENRSVSISSDPLSPKIGCMGQVKRSNKIVGFPASSTKPSFSTKNINNATTGIKYPKLKKIFSSKNLIYATATTSSITSRRRDQAMLNHGKENSVSVVSIDEMDPPLPVIKKVEKIEGEGAEMESLWKRRSGGATLKNLQLQHIQLIRLPNLAPSTV